MKNNLFLLLLILIMAACTDGVMDCEPSQENENDANSQLGYLHFSSANDLIASLSSQNNHSGKKRIKGASEYSAVVAGGAFVSLMAPIDTAINLYARTDDGIILHEMKNYNVSSQDAMIVNNNLNIYIALGYDTIVPDVEFAELLNIKGEIQVADTIYKISPRGTYFFLSSLEKYFSKHFSEYEDKEGVLIAENTYKLDDVGIYRYGTFDNNPAPTEGEDEDLPDEVNDCIMAPYTEVTNPFANEVDWSVLPKEKSNAKTIIGKIWQSLFGCNKGFHYKIAKKRRVTGKLFYYNYIIYSSTGASVKMEKKNWIGWSDTKADKLTVDWNNIVFETKYNINPPVGGIKRAHT